MICLSFIIDHQLSRKVVQNIHLSGGSLLGVSRGGPSVSEIVDNMEVIGSFFHYSRMFACFLEANAKL